MLGRIEAYLGDKVDYPTEAKDIDFKSAVKFDKNTDFAAKLVKHILGFANAGGGYIIIGFREKPDKDLELDPALTEEIVASYEVTKLCQYVEKYLAEQDRIKVVVHKIPSSQGMVHPIISVGRFAEYPFVCRRNYTSQSTGETILESGRVYIRTEGARTLAVEAPSEWHQLIRECIKAAKEAEAKRPREEEEEDQWKTLFSEWSRKEDDNARREMDAAGFHEGFYRFVVRVPFHIDRIDNIKLLEIARRSQCRNTGWPIGVVLEKPEDRPISLSNGIHARISPTFLTVDNIDIREFDYWALSNRGHFFFVRTHDDGHLQNKAGRQSVISFGVVIWRISEILCYASNLSDELTLREKDKIGLDLYYEGLKGRVLLSGHHKRPYDVVSGPSVENTFEKHLELGVADIMPKLKDYVYHVTSALFELFDFYKLDRATSDSIVDDFLSYS